MENWYKYIFEIINYQVCSLLKHNYYLGKLFFFHTRWNPHIFILKDFKSWSMDIHTYSYLTYFARLVEKDWLNFWIPYILRQFSYKIKPFVQSYIFWTLSPDKLHINYISVSHKIKIYIWLILKKLISSHFFLGNKVQVKLLYCSSSLPCLVVYTFNCHCAWLTCNLYIYYVPSRAGLSNDETNDNRVKFSEPHHCYVARLA